MKKCCVCRNSITDDEAMVLFVGQAGDDKEVCKACKQQLDVLKDGKKPDEVKDAINYLYTCLQSAGDPEVASLLEDAIKENSPVAEETEDASKESKPVDMSKKSDYFSDGRREADVERSINLWISCVRIIAWVVFFVVIYFGISKVPEARQSGIFFVFLQLAATFAGAFLPLGLVQIIIYIAQGVRKTKDDVSQIKQILREKDKRQ